MTSRNSRSTEVIWTGRKLSRKIRFESFLFLEGAITKYGVSWV